MNVFLATRRLVILFPIILWVSTGCSLSNNPCHLGQFRLQLVDQEQLLTESETLHIREFIGERYPGVVWDSGGLTVSYRICSSDPEYAGMLGLCWVSEGVAEVYVGEHWIFPGSQAIAIGNTTVHEIGHYVGLEHTDALGSCMGLAQPWWGLEFCHCGS